MPLPEQRRQDIRQMSDWDLMGNAQTDDLASLVESNFRLRRSGERLTGVLIALTILLAILALPLFLESVIKFYHHGFN